MKREEIEEKVKEFLHERRDEFERASKDLKSFFESYRRQPEGARTTYQVNGRDYYQNGTILKTEESIVDKIEEKHAEQEAKGKSPTYDIENVEDIVGVRIICVYPTDAKSVCNYITDSADSKNQLDIIKRPTCVQKDSGYKAWHAIVRPKGYSESIKCEVQIVTMLQEAWSFKAHDLVYKGENVEAKYQKHTKYLSDSLEAIDSQSELVKDQIEEMRKEEENRRISLVGEHLLLLLGADEEKWELDEALSSLYDPRGISFDNVGNSEQAMKLLKYLSKEKTSFGFSGGTVKEEDILLLSKQIAEYEKRYKVYEKRKQYKICGELSLLASLCAVLSESEKCKVDALDCADKLIKYAEEKDKALKNRIGALVHKGWAFFCLRNYKEALKCVDMAIKLTDASSTRGFSRKNKAKNDWAYFAAELTDESRKKGRKPTPQQIEERKERAFLYIRDIISKAKEKQLKLQWEDTLGFIYIVFGEEYREIEKGRQICEKAYHDSLERATPTQQRIGELYYLKHVRRALERALDFLK